MPAIIFFSHHHIITRGYNLSFLMMKIALKTLIVVSFSITIFKFFILCFLSNNVSSHSCFPYLFFLFIFFFFFQVMAGQRRVNGVEAMIVDTTSLSVMVQSIGIPNKDGEKVSQCYPMRTNSNMPSCFLSPILTSHILFLP